MWCRIESSRRKGIKSPDSREPSLADSCHLSPPATRPCHHDAATFHMSRLDPAREEKHLVALCFDGKTISLAPAAFNLFSQKYCWFDRIRERRCARLPNTCMPKAWHNRTSQHARAIPTGTRGVREY